MTYLNSKDYLQKRLSGEKIVSAATIYGINAMASQKYSDSFIVFALNHNGFSCFEYKVKQGKFYVSANDENKPFNITMVSTEMLQDEAILRWWNCVFYKQAGVRYYDKEYDTLNIANDCTTVFKDVIKEFSDSISSMGFPKKECPVFLTGDLAENPLLQYVLQQQFSMKEIMVLTCKEKENLYVNENDIVALPESQLNKLKLNTNTTISLASIVSNPLRVILPLDSSIRSVMASNLKWEDVLIDSQNDYCLKDLGFKTVSLSVECDSFQNIFLSCVDLNSNRKVLQVK